MADIGTAYVLIEPSAKGLGGKIENEMNGIGEKSGSSFAGGFGRVMGGVAKVALGAVTAGAGAMAAVTKQAVSSYADYEQLIGGMETLYEDLSYDVEENAKRAYMTAGLSANEYMETALSFAASLNNSLVESEGDISRSADLTDQIIVDMADNVNKMGTSMESVQNAYRGFSRGNFTMLDNLALGFAGTKQGMQQLLDKASELSGQDFDIGNFADIAEAIHIVQTDMGITGTTAKEASETIAGSLNQLKSSWQNVITGLGDTSGESPLEEYIQNLVDSAKTVATNMLPVIKQAVSGLATMIAELAPVIASELPKLLTDALPGLLEAGLAVAQTLAEGILNALPTLLPNLVNFIIGLGNMIISNLPLLLKTGLMIIVELAKGIAAAIPDLMPTITEVIVEIAMMLTDPDMLISLVEAGLELMIALAEGLVAAIPQLIERLPEIIDRLVSTLIDLAPRLLVAAGKLVLTLAEGLLKAVGSLVNAVIELWNRLKETWTSKIGDVKKWGKDLIDNFINGIKEKWESFKQTLSDLANTVKDFLGFSVPEKGPLHEWAYKNPGYDMVALFTEGMEEATPNLEAALSQNIALPMYDAMDFTATSNGGAGATNVTVKLEGDASKFFTYIQDENRIYKKMNGESAFA